MLRTPVLAPVVAVASLIATAGANPDFGGSGWDFVTDPLCMLPGTAPVRSGTSAVFEPGSELEVLCRRPVTLTPIPGAGVMAGVHFGVTMTRRTQDQDPLIGLSDGTRVLLFEVTNDGEFYIRPTDDHGATVVGGPIPTPYMTGLAFPPVNGSFEFSFTLYLESSGALGVGRFGTAQGALVSLPGLDPFASLEVILVRGDGPERYQLDEVFLDAFSCPADLTATSDAQDPGYGFRDGAVDASDFFYYLDQFELGNLAVTDLTGSSDPNDPSYGVPNGIVDADDFFYYLDLFTLGCP